MFCHSLLKILKLNYLAYKECGWMQNVNTFPLYVKVCKAFGYLYNFFHKITKTGIPNKVKETDQIELVFYREENESRINENKCYFIGRKQPEQGLDAVKVSDNIETEDTKGNEAVNNQKMKWSLEVLGNKQIWGKHKIRD